MAAEMALQPASAVQSDEPAQLRSETPRRHPDCARPAAEPAVNAEEIPCAHEPSGAEIAPRDAFWPWLDRKTNRIVVLTVYRAAAFFGVASTLGWIIWALFVNDFMPHLDWSIGGPKWAPPQGPP